MTLGSVTHREQRMKTTWKEILADRAELRGRFGGQRDDRGLGAGGIAMRSRLD